MQENDRIIMVNKAFAIMESALNKLYDMNNIKIRNTIGSKTVDLFIILYRNIKFD
jgi:hypothetical protein